MTARRLSTRLLLGKEDVPATREDFEVVGAFNPGAVRAGAEVVLLVRVAERPRERRPGFTGLPRWDPREGLTIDWDPDADLERVDPRVVRRKSDGCVRLTFASHLRVVLCGDGRYVREVTDIAFRPQGHLEEFGVSLGEHQACSFEITVDLLPFAKLGDHVLQFALLLGDFTIAFVVVDDFGVRHLAGELFEASFEPFEFLSILHGRVCSLRDD